MNYHNYYTKIKQEYWIRFRTDKKINKTDMINIFSTYGTLTNASRLLTANKHGVRTAIYKTLKDALACIIGLQNEEHIKILINKTNLYEETKTTRNDTVNKEGFANTSNMLNANKIQEASNDDKDDKIECKLECNEVSMMYNDKQNDKDFKNNEGSSTSSKLLSANKKSPKSLTKSSIRSIKTDTDYSDFSYASSLTFSEKSPSEDNEKIDTESHNIINAERYTYPRSMKSLTKIDSHASSIIETKSVLAEDIIVANIPEEITIFTILDLCYQHNPIGISLMKTVHSTGIRYCHVYFRNAQDGFDFTLEFDKMFIVINIDRYINVRSIESFSDFMYYASSSTIVSKSFLAEDVIVANLPKETTQLNIHALCSKYEPIAVSLVKTIDSTGIRYAHVYFKSPQYASRFETEFYKLQTHHRDLIVLRSCSLLKEIGME